MKSSVERCYLCDGTDNITRDHIPPKGLFTKPLPSDLITAPCCAACNHAFHKQDELLRLLVSGGFNRNELGDAIWKRVEERTLKRKRLRSHVHNMVKSASFKELLSPAGAIELACVTVPQQDLDGAIIRIVKGLLWFHLRSIPRNQLDYSIIQIDQTRLNELLNPILHKLPLYRIKGGGAFRYWGGLTKDHPRRGIWILMFYDSIAFAVFHKPKEVEQSVPGYPPQGVGSPEP